MDPSRPLVSVIVPFRDAASSLARTIDSVLDLKGSVELLLVDNGSTDGSLELAERYRDRARVLQEPLTGGNRARNRGALVARGQWLLFLDADDWLDPDYLDRVVVAIERSHGDLIFSRAIVHREHGVLTMDPAPDVIDRDSILAAISEYRFVQCPGQALIHRDLYARIGGWNPDLPRLQDFFFLIHAVRHARKIGYSGGHCHKDDLPRPGRVGSSRDFPRELQLVRTAAAELTHLHGKIPKSVYMTIMNGLYGIACNYFASDDLVGGRESLAPLLRIPDFRHQGPVWHRTLCALLGIERRYRLIRKLKSFW